MSDSHTVIVGGGIVGVCAAYFLARRGVRVTLLEMEQRADGASSGNAGLISIGHGPIPRPGLTAKAIRWMFDPGSPIYIRPRLDPALLRWFWGFRRACARDTHLKSLQILAEHGWPAGACFRDLVEGESLDCEYRPVGQLDVYLTQAGLDEGKREADIVRKYGYNIDVLDGNALREREPAFRNEVIGATLYTDRAFANPGQFVTEMTDRSRQRGAEMRSGVEVTALLVTDDRCSGVQLSDGERLEADTVLLAAGVWSTKLARAIGIRIPMQPAKGYHADLTPPTPCTGTACVCAERFVAVTPMGGGLRLAGTLELSGINDRIVQRRVDMLRRGAGQYLRGIDDTTIRETWCGMRPCTADGLPILGWAPSVRNLFIATGHAMMGFALGPLAGRVASECITDGTPSVDVSSMRADRF